SNLSLRSSSAAALPKTRPGQLTRTFSPESRRLLTNSQIDWSAAAGESCSTSYFDCPDTTTVRARGRKSEIHRLVSKASDRVSCLRWVASNTTGFFGERTSTVISTRRRAFADKAIE